MNPAGRRFEWGVRIHAVRSISEYDGRRASLYALHEVTLNGISRPRVIETLHSTISSLSARPRVMVEKWHVAQSELPPSTGVPP